MFRSRLTPGFRLVYSIALAAGVFLGHPLHAQKMEPPPGDGVESVANTELKNDQLAARFLDQATAGATPEDIAALSLKLTSHPNTAFAEWLNDQYAKPVQPEDLSLNIFRSLYDNKTPDTSFRKHAGDAGEIRASLMISDNNNELRRAVAYALSQIFVVSDQDNPLNGASEGLCDWYDMLYKDAFTDFNTILTDVTYHPVMSDFLSSEGNAKAGYYNKNSRPDENYAREVMQLFTIGLLQLNEDGSIITDAQGHAIPTYTQPEITEVARVFTGLKYPKGMGMAKKRAPDGTETFVPKKENLRYGRDEIDEKRHDTGEKAFLGTTLPAGQTAEKDIADFLQILCNHPNAAPFFAKGMIQRLVTSNPSPAYIKRVAEAFRSSKGDMKTVISAILLDDEARNPAFAKKDTYGKLREPWLRFTELERGFHAVPAAAQPFYPTHAAALLPKLAQFPLSAPSVFNFYLPNYQPPGPITDRNANATDGTTLLAAPEFQVVNSNTALTTPNLWMNLLRRKSNPDHKPNQYDLPELDLTPQINMAQDSVALVDNVSTILTGGTMSDRTRDIITNAVNQLTPANDPNVLKERARTAIYLTMVSPDYAVQK